MFLYTRLVVTITNKGQPGGFTFSTSPPSSDPFTL
jgi:hypothetical protein